MDYITKVTINKIEQESHEEIEQSLSTMITSEMKNLWNILDIREEEEILFI